MSLTENEKIAGRAFRAGCQADLDCLNEYDPPDFRPPHFIAVFRHICPAKGNRTVAIELRECYRHSPQDSAEQVPAARFGFLYREGRCRACGQTARSTVGRVVDAHVRPPIDGRTSSGS